MGVSGLDTHWRKSSTFEKCISGALGGTDDDFVRENSGITESKHNRELGPEYKDILEIL